MTSIDFVVRTPAGAVQGGSVAGPGDNNTIQIAPGSDISLNLSQSELQIFDRAGADLLITLADGRVVVVEDYFASGPMNRLYVSADSQITEVQFVEIGDGQLMAQMGNAAEWGKWSPADELIFVEEPQIAAPIGAEDEEVSMLAAPLLGGLMGGGAGLGAGAAALGGAALLGLGGGGDGDGDGDGGGDGAAPLIPASVDNAETPITVYGDEDQEVVVTGTAEPGAEVTVVIGGETVVTTATDPGVWEAVFTGDDFPADGSYGAEVTVAQPDGTVVELDGPQVAIDVTPPELKVEDGTTSVGDVVNAEDHADGVTLSGAVEPGATVVVSAGGTDHDADVDAAGGWTVTLDGAALPGGEYTESVTITATDAAGNATTVADGVQIDTETSVAFSAVTIAGDGVINAAERAAGVGFDGTAEPGATVVVTIAGASQTATADASGGWSVRFEADDLPEGTRDATVEAVATDPAGNTASASRDVRIDTDGALGLDTDGVEGDGTVNAAERADGVDLTGTGEPGATVEVTLAGVTRGATVEADGTWTVSYPASAIPTGEQSVTVTAVSTDAAGNIATTTGEIAVDTLVRDFELTDLPGGDDGIINAAEAAGGASFGGTVEPGSTVSVTFAGITRAATVDAAGGWRVDYAAGELPAGEGSHTITAVATDAAGNAATLERDVQIDTDPGTLTISATPVEGDDVINGAEAADGVTLTGTSDPGQAVVVEMGDATRTVTTDASGIWRATFLPGQIAPGTYDAPITATITDAAGNTLTRTDSVHIDTEVRNFSLSADPVEGDNVVNEVEASDGIAFSGTTEPGATVDVIFQGVTRAATVDATGNWTAGFAAGEIRAGTYDASARVMTTDRAGNETESTLAFRVDTEVTELTQATPAAMADGVINAVEANGGVILTGRVEAGSSVAVSIGGIVHAASVDAGGAWSVEIAGADLPRGTLDVPVEITAIDAAGNTRAITETLSFDTDVPSSPDVESYTRDHRGLRGVSLETTDEEIAISHVTDSGTVEPVSFASFDVPALGETNYAFTENVPDGSHLVVSGTDAAGNVSGTYLVLDDTTTSDVTMTDALAQALSGHGIETVDLQFAEDSRFTITEAQIKALFETTDTLTIVGGGDDQVTITGAQPVGSEVEDGQSFTVFTLGEASVRIEDDITNVVI